MKEDIKKYSILSEKIKQSDHKAYIELFNMLWEPMFVYARAILGDDDLAKDLMQNVWASYWVKREKMEVINIKAYLFISLRNACYKSLSKDKIRTEQLEVIKEIQFDHNENSDTTSCSYDELTESITRSLENLPQRCKEIFEMSRLNGISNKEIASELKISKRTVENQLSIALKKVRKDLVHFVKMLL
ncbi:RNA polymerase sigma-70 factor [Sinomicrobium soli]|uniref:RNA polymerase sigma-70 factor n=1 Tax=Sinomicrobium sp. N-1-3-6 TaxID=2219864 RepID=UPI000DCD5432|nr:RNA polymerase sigma-70 factor [Sinomicrobium sp. N-1-3-6]RAV27792.1 RNA polymerase sigma-70 factor [Sinomicrobium sp. N-1-3-6]